MPNGRQRERQAETNQKLNTRKIELADWDPGIVYDSRVILYGRGSKNIALDLPL